MDPSQKDELSRLLGSRVEFGVSMARFTTFRVGGRAEAMCRIMSLEELKKVVSYLGEQGVPRLVAGWGSNLLVREDGFPGAVLLLGGELARIHRGDRPEQVLAGAGVRLADLLGYCRSSGLGGLEFLAGIPGTVGGAVAMNAGSFGGEVSDRVRELHTVSRRGEVTVQDRSRLQFAYRKLRLEPDAVITGALFELKPEAREAVSERIRENLKKRSDSQPLEHPSAGSVFKNPPQDYAGRLIEAAGLKGKRIGQAMISEKHANYIVNLGGATASDVLALMDLARNRVREQSGIELEAEIRVVGGADSAGPS